MTDLDDADRCPSLSKVILHREDTPDHEVYLRCQTTRGHTGKNHRSWLRSWTTDEEDGRIS